MVDMSNFARNDSGQVAVIFSLALLPILALTSAAVDYSQLTKERAKVSSALDSAVLAAANNNAITLSEKDTYAKTHFLANYNGDIALDVTSSVTSSRVRLVASGELDLTLGNLVGIDNPKLVEASAATIATENTICVLALSEKGDASISFDRDMEFLASGCAVHSNSKSKTAIITEKNITLPTASSFCAVGGISGDVEPHSKGECNFVADPYSDIPLAREKRCQTIVTDALEETLDVSEPVFEESVLPTLSNLPPLPFDDALDKLIDIHGTDMFEADSEGRLRAGNHPDAIRLAAELEAEDLYKLISLYDYYGGDYIRCVGSPSLRCTDFNNPFANNTHNEVPRKGVLLDIFALNYGPLPQSLSIPGLVELIDGQLYSRDIDNELVPVSSNLTGDDIRLSPGTYCGGLTVDGLSVEFSPGDYIFKDGPLTFLNKSEADADRVTFGFKGAGATLNIESGSSLEIRSATDGPREGLAFMNMVDSTAPGNRPASTGINRIASGGSVSLSGTAYFPQQSLMISGEDSQLGASSPAVGLIADTISFRGNRGSRVFIGVDHKKAGIPPIQPQVDDGVRLVE